jgi:serine/threonine-protein phosphatase 2A regulatory subunit B'
MVYNAMKLFMEINPQLFDECSHDYNELQNTAGQREKAREAKWAKLSEQANRMKQGLAKPPTTPSITEVPETDAAQDNQERLDALKLHDESSTGKPSSVSILLSPSPITGSPFSPPSFISTWLRHLLLL